MGAESLLFSFFLIFTGATVLSTAALFLRIPLLVAYILAGILLGPFGLGWISDAALLVDIAEIGILFLLFLLGLDMQPVKLMATLRNTFWVTLISSLLFLALGLATGLLFAFSPGDSLVIGFAMIFSSTIIGIKLLHTTVLHQRHMGELMVGILLLQDFIAIFLLVFLDQGELARAEILRTLLAFPALLLLAWGMTRFVLVPLVARYDQFREYLFLLAIGWCLGMAETAELLGLTAEVGAFAAGVSLATSPVSMYLSDRLKPLRDFFLILFFFSLGAQFNIALLDRFIWPAVILSALALSLKPLVFRTLLLRFSERRALAWDAGLRLGQISEFSLLIAFVAYQAGSISEMAAMTIQGAAILTFLFSSCFVVMLCPTPIAVNPRLRRD